MLGVSFHAIREQRKKILTRLLKLEPFVERAETIPGWVGPQITREIGILSYRLPPNPTIVEVGSFMGRSTTLLAGARYLRGTGKVHAIDPFDCSGDDFSIPFYEKLLEDSGSDSLEEVFRNNMRQCGLEPWIEVYKGTSFEIVASWKRPIDLLLLDGDQTPHMQRESYDFWIPYLKKGGQFILHNAGDREYEAGHDGSHILAEEEIRPPKFVHRRFVEQTLFAQKA